MSLLVRRPCSSPHAVSWHHGLMARKCAVNGQWPMDFPNRRGQSCLLSSWGDISSKVEKAFSAPAFRCRRRLNLSTMKRQMRWDDRCEDTQFVKPVACIAPSSVVVACLLACFTFRRLSLPGVRYDFDFDISSGSILRSGTPPKNITGHYVCP